MVSGSRTLRSPLHYHMRAKEWLADMSCFRHPWGDVLPKFNGSGPPLTCCRM